MPLLEWSDKLDISVDSMNAEHLKLIDLMNATYAANGHGVAVVSLALTNLVDFVVEHFDNEEAYMESIGFEGLKNHQGIHKTLLSKAGEHVEAFNSSGTDVLPEEFFQFLKFWLVSHIQGIDMKYGDFSNSPEASVGAGTV